MALIREQIRRMSQGGEPWEEDRSEDRLDVTVLFTSIGATVAALRTAGELAARLHARITLLAPHVVPYPLPLAEPTVRREFNERRFRVLTEGCKGIETRVRIFLCRDRMDAVESALKPRSVVVLGTRARWWPAAERKLAKRLQRAGHEVVLVTYRPEERSD